MPFRIIQITDCHLFADKSKIAGEGISSFDTLFSVLKAAGEYAPDLVIVTGDLSADETAESYQHFQYIWQQAQISAPLKVIPGNHDDANVMADYFVESFWQGKPIQTNNWMLHNLHSQVAGTGKGKVSDEQLITLQRHLDEQRERSHLVAVHHHPVPMKSWMDKLEWMNRDTFIALVERNHNIKVIIHGHVHTARDIGLGNARLLATPSTCWQFKHEVEFAYEQRPPAFRIMDLNSNGTFNSCVKEVKQDRVG